MRKRNYLLYLGVGAAVLYAYKHFAGVRGIGAPTIALWSPSAADLAVSALNTGVYNPVFNPGGQTDYTASFMGLDPATGWAGSSPLA